MIQVNKRIAKRPEPPDDPEPDAVEVFSSPCGFSWDDVEPCRENDQDGELAPADSDDGLD